LPPLSRAQPAEIREMRIAALKAQMEQLRIAKERQYGTVQ
jgi:hypothetical protein